VVLDELHVLEGHAGSIGQGHPVGGVDGRVGGEREDPAQAPGAQDDRLRGDAPNLRVAEGEGGHARAPAVFDQELGDEELVVADDARVLERGLEQGVQQVEPGLVCGEDRAVDAHPPEGPDGEAPVGLPAPGAPPVFDLDDLLRSFRHERLHGVLVGEIVAPPDGVERVEVQAIVGPEGRSGATLRGNRVAPHGIDLRHQGDAELRGDFRGGDGSPKPGRPAPHDDDVVLDRLQRPLPPEVPGPFYPVKG